MNRYVVVFHKDLDAVTKTVNEKMEAGYIPLGGISVRADFMFFQAMVLHDERVFGKDKIGRALDQIAVDAISKLESKTLPLKETPAEPITESPHANRE